MNASTNVLDQADVLVGQGRFAEALAITEPLARAPDAPHAVLASHSAVLKGLRRHEEALAIVKSLLPVLERVLGGNHLHTLVMPARRAHPVRKVWLMALRADDEVWRP